MQPALPGDQIADQKLALKTQDNGRAKRVVTNILTTLGIVKGIEIVGRVAGHINVQLLRDHKFGDLHSIIR